MDLKDVGLRDGDENTKTLWAYPAQRNVTGSRLGLDLTRELKRRSDAAVLVDAASYLSTSVLDLDSIPYEEDPDFLVCSFYKMYVRSYNLIIIIQITPHSGPTNRPWRPHRQTIILALTRSSCPFLLRWRNHRRHLRLFIFLVSSSQHNPLPLLSVRT
jgi:hypothetical protein